MKMKAFMMACFYVQMICVFFFGACALLNLAQYLHHHYSGFLWAGGVAFAGLSVNIYLACRTFTRMTELP